MDTPSYSIDVRSILEDLGATLSVDSKVDLPAITVGTETFTTRGPAALRLDVTNTGAGIVASGTVGADFDAICSRCLEPFVLAITTQVDGFYVSHGGEYELPEEQEYGFVEEGAIDVMPAVLAALVLDLPFAPLHDPECKGICPACGADLNAGSCECPAPRSASPFSVLKELLPDTDDTA